MIDQTKYAPSFCLPPIIGGFQQLEYDTEAKFPSELAPDGVVGWHTTKMDHEGWVNVHYPDIK